MRDDIRRLKALAAAGDSEAAEVLEAIERRARTTTDSTLEALRWVYTNSRGSGKTEMNTILYGWYLHQCGLTAPPPPRLKRYRKPRYRLL